MDRGAHEADTIFALVMATSRRLVELAAHVREGRWTRNIDESLFGWDACALADQYVL